MNKSVLIFALAFFVACQKPAAKKNIVTAHNAKNSLDYVGTYKGILPCADCQGLETELTVNENETFCIKSKYLGKGEKIFIQKGHFKWNKNGNTIILIDIEGAPNQYFVGENTLTQLDIYGQKIKGSLADEYILSKQPIDTTDMEATEEKEEVTVDLNNRMTTVTSIEKVNPAVGKYTLAETKWKLVQLNKNKISQKGKKPYFIKMNSNDGRFSAYMGCNTIWGSYDMPSADRILFSQMIMTEMACTDMALENNFNDMLGKVAIYKLDKETLIFFSEDKHILARFEAINN
ncbi:MAG: copper resistance protein NlpE N-terminal domain-containing protein [Flavobacterium sp.]